MPRAAPQGERAAGWRRFGLLAALAVTCAAAIAVAMAIVGLSGAGKGLDDAAREKLVAAIAEDSARACAQYLAGGQLSFEAVTSVATAVS